MDAYYPFSIDDYNKFGLKISSPFGWRKRNDNWEFHDGEDWYPSKLRWFIQNRISNKDIIIRASDDGELMSGKDQYGGLYQVVRNDDGISFMTVHQKSFIRNWGRVEKGEPIGIMGSTGLSTGVHTHFEMDDTTTGEALNPSLQNLTFYSENNTEMIDLNHKVGCEISKDTRFYKRPVDDRSKENTITTARKGYRFNSPTVAYDGKKTLYRYAMPVNGKMIAGWSIADNIRQYPTSDLASRDRLIELDRVNRKLTKELEKCLNDN